VEDAMSALLPARETLRVTVSVLDLPDVMAVMHAARDLVDHASADENALQVWYRLVPENDLNRLAEAVSRILPGLERA
jgi:hypothetical protein